ncbi:MAG TPA: SRPBCC domain-containing protein, partial [Planctomycetota bacterium]|nr:SRPBCC domain-containing protein [Planctomycetota bacterium]
MTEKRRREHAHEFEIAAPPGEVWKAITDAESLANWFPFDARVEPGPGGKIVLRWGPELECVCRIEAWEPDRHLRTTWMEKPATGEGAAMPAGPGALLPLAVDWRIEGKKGSTILRLVHSGF